MPDFSSLSDAELKQIADGGTPNASAAPDGKGLGSLSDADLQKLAGPEPTKEGWEGFQENMARRNEQDAASNDALFNTLTLGYLPQIKAGAEHLYNMATNQDTPDEYVKMRDAEIKGMQERAEKYPGSHYLGAAAGFAAPMLATGGGSAVAEAAPTLSQVIGRGAVTGAAYGGLANPGDEEGKVDPIQAAARAKNAAVGAGTGAVLSAATSQIPKAAEALNDFAETKAFKGGGAMLKDFRTANARDEINETGRFMLDNGLIKAGDNFDSVADKARAFNTDAGKRLGKIYDTALETAKGLGPEAQESITAAGFNPVRDKDAIMNAAKEALGHDVKRRSALSSLESYLDDIAEQYGNTTLDPRTSNDIKSALQAQIKWSRNPLNPDPASETAFNEAQRFVNGKVKSHVGALGDAIGNPDAAQELAKANHEYGMSKNIMNMASDRVNREEANRMFGLTDTISGGAGATAGAMIAGRPGAMVGGAVGAVGNKIARSYGNGAMAQGSDAISKMLMQTPRFARMAESNPAAYEKMVENFGSRVGGLTPAAATNELDKDSSTRSQYNSTPESPQQSQQKFLQGN